ncbi:MAG TPA: DUF1003 domain-containing protein [Vicinamibacterales bacterium]|nr:DUF1003 domain-containing protein [Vicinamibacterales bacterium]
MRKSSRVRTGDPAVDNVKAVANLERDVRRAASPGERVAHAFSTMVGQIGFVIAQLVAIAAWIAWNTAGPEPSRFDPYPYVLLTLIVTCEGVLIATFILIAQNRMSKQNDQRDHLHLQINLLAEQELTLVLKLLRRVADRLEVASDTADDQLGAKLAEETDISQLVERLRRELLKIDDQ